MDPLVEAPLKSLPEAIKEILWGYVEKSKNNDFVLATESEVLRTIVNKALYNADALKSALKAISQ
jgi:hypothetical protein